MAGLITGAIALGLHLFCKFRLANSLRSRWTKTLIPSLLLPRRLMLSYCGASGSG